MGLKDKIIENLDKMGGVCDVNTNQYYHMQEYKEALQFAQKYQNIAGVPEEIKNLKENHNKYRKNFNDALNQVYDEWNQKHRTWMRVNTAKNLLKRITIGAAVIVVVGFVANGIISWRHMEGILETIDELLTALAMELTFWCGVAWLGLCIAEKYSFNQYSNAKNKVSNYIANQVTDPYLQSIRRNRNKVDNIYLASLSPEHRELVLMRRDQERQHQEAMRQQERQNEAIRAEQERARIAQEELLRIEREREERYRRV